MYQIPQLPAVDVFGSRADTWQQRELLAEYLRPWSEPWAQVYDIRGSRALEYEGPVSGFVAPQPLLPPGLLIPEVMPPEVRPTGPEGLYVPDYRVPVPGGPPPEPPPEPRKWMPPVSILPRVLGTIGSILWPTDITPEVEVPRTRFPEQIVADILANQLPPMPAPPVPRPPISPPTVTLPSIPATQTPPIARPPIGTTPPAIEIPPATVSIPSPPIPLPAPAAPIIRPATPILPGWWPVLAPVAPVIPRLIRGRRLRFRRTPPPAGSVSPISPAVSPAFPSLPPTISPALPPIFSPVSPPISPAVPSIMTPTIPAPRLPDTVWPSSFPTAPTRPGRISPSVDPAVPGLSWPGMPEWAPALEVPTAPLTRLQPPELESPRTEVKRDRCQCECPKPKKRGQKKRTDCRYGFYQETETSVLYTPWRVKSCLSSKKKLPLLLAGLTTTF